MSLVSKRKINKDLERHLYHQLADVLLAHDTRRASRNLVRELFTPTERLMFAKRVSIIALIERGYTSYSIALALHVSPSTVARIGAKKSCGTYAHIVKTIRNKQSRVSILKTLESLLTLGFPGEAGKRVRAQMRKDIESWRAGS